MAGYQDCREKQNKDEQSFEFIHVVMLSFPVENTVLSLPLSDDYLEEAFELDPYYQDVEKELEVIKTSFASSNRISD